MDFSKEVSKCSEIPSSSRSNTGNQYKRNAIRKMLEDDMIDGECKELGTETEAEKQLKRLLEKQLDTKLTLQQQLQQHKEFTPSGNYVPINQIVCGVHSLQNFINIEQDDLQVQELQKCGLTKEEIDIYISYNGFQSAKKRKFSLNPDILSQKLDIIMQKIYDRNLQFDQPTHVSGIKQLSRHEMDIEQTLYAGCQNKEQFKHLVTINGRACQTVDGPYKHIAELSEKIKKFVKRKKIQKNHDNIFTSAKKNSEDSQFQNVKECDLGISNKPDSSVFHAVVLLDETTIQKNKLSITEIQKIPKFHNYSPGIPSKVLYIKNLHAKVDIRQLISLFDRFTNSLNEPPQYRLMTGKMRGQAFITFEDAATAEKALQLVNGYKLYEQPIIIQFGKNQSKI